MTIDDYAMVGEWLVSLDFWGEMLLHAEDEASAQLALGGIERAFTMMDLHFDRLGAS